MFGGFYNGKSDTTLMSMSISILNQYIVQAGVMIFGIYKSGTNFSFLLPGLLIIPLQVLKKITQLPANVVHFPCKASS